MPHILKTPLRCSLSAAKPTRHVTMQARAYTGTVRMLAAVARNPGLPVRMATPYLVCYHEDEPTKLDETDDG